MRFCWLARSFLACLRFSRKRAMTRSVSWKPSVSLVPDAGSAHTRVFFPFFFPFSSLNRGGSDSGFSDSVMTICSSSTRITSTSQCCGPLLTRGSDSAQSFFCSSAIGLLSRSIREEENTIDRGGRV